MLTMGYAIKNRGHWATFHPGSHFCYRFFTTQNLYQMARDGRSWKPVDIWDDESGRRFYPFNNFEDGAALGRRARNVRGFWFQRFIFAFVANNGFEGSCDSELFCWSFVYENELKSILISSDVRLFEHNIEGQRKMAFWTSDSDGESIKKEDINPKFYWKGKT